MKQTTKILARAASDTWTMLVNRAKFAAVLAIVISISGCSLPLHVDLYNASGEVIVVTRKDDKRETIEISINDRSYSEIKGLFDRRFSIQGGRTSKAYARQTVPESFIEGVGTWPFFKRKAKAEIYPDGCIYLIQAGSPFPAQARAMQPKGFPVCGGAVEVL